MAEYPIYAGDMTIDWIERPCAARQDEGTCEDAARQIGVNPQSSWTRPHSGQYGWVCSAHDNVMTTKYEPERRAALDAQLAAEGAAFWSDYGIEASETPRITAEEQARDALNSDI